MYNNNLTIFLVRSSCVNSTYFLSDGIQLILAYAICSECFVNEQTELRHIHYRCSKKERNGMRLKGMSLVMLELI